MDAPRQSWTGTSGLGERLIGALHPVAEPGLLGQWLSLACGPGAVPSPRRRTGRTTWTGGSFPVGSGRKSHIKLKELRYVLCRRQAIYLHQYKPNHDG
jgi:hypothetical protein